MPSVSCNLPQGATAYLPNGAVLLVPGFNATPEANRVAALNSNTVFCAVNLGTPVNGTASGCGPAVQVPYPYTAAQVLNANPGLPLNIVIP